MSLTNVLAQDRDADISSEQLREMARSTAVPDQRTVETKGSPFLNEEFANGSVTFQNGLTTNVMPLRFNIYENSLQFMDNNQIYAINSETINEFELYASDGIITFKKGYDARRLNADEFVAVLADGEAKLMVKYDVNYRENISGYGQATQVEEYSKSENYYVKFGGNDVDRLRRLDERRVLNSFPSHKIQLEQFASQQNIRFDNARDVAKLFKYYNSLLNEDA